MDHFHPNVPTNDIADPELDPCLILIKLEEQFLEEYSLNLKGITVNTPLNPVIDNATAGKLVHTRYTDILDVIDDKVTSEQLKARVLSSLAWMIDSQIVSTARQFLFSEFKESELQGTADGLDVFMREFTGNLQIEEVFGGGGNGTTLVQLLGLRLDYHDAAGSAADSIGRVYDPKSFDALIAGEKPRNVGADQKRQQAMLVKAMCEMYGEGSPAEEEQMLKDMEQRNQTRAQAQLELNKKVGPTTLDIINQATRYVKPSRFEELDAVVRERLIKVSQKFLKNAATDLASYKLSDSDYMEVLFNMRAFIKETDLILATQYKPEPTAHVRTAARAMKNAAANSDAQDFEADVQARTDARSQAQTT